jgi:hypothetical protein
VPPTATPADGRLTARKRARHPVANLDDHGVTVMRQTAEPPRRRAQKKRAQDPPPELRTVSIDEFCALASVSRMTCWRMLRRGDIESITIGVKRLILLNSWHRLIERKLAEGR